MLKGICWICVITSKYVTDMIDKLSLTIYSPPDKTYLDTHGEVSEDTYRSHIYKLICRLDRAVVFYYPHKFSEGRNAKIPFTKIDLNPKYFECYESMEAYISSIFASPVDPEEFNVSRLDVAVDVEAFSIDVLLSIMRIKNIRMDSLSFYKGTIYVGYNPKIRIYEKVKEIKERVKKGFEITEYERGLLESGKSYTRFEIQIRNVNKTLKEVAENPTGFSTYYDRLEFFRFGDNGDSGILQVLFKYINRKFRVELEKFRDRDMTMLIKEQFEAQVGDWFAPKEPF